jgi:glycosyltransferase involved in cell wall biosynthesis
MSYHANVAAALYLLNAIMPHVWERYPEARVQVVGQNPPDQLLYYAQRDPEHIDVTGSVEDLRPFLAEATLAVAPLTYGAGIQNKVLEAMAMQTPVVATTRAVSALSVQSEQEVLIGDDAEMLSQQINRLLRNQGLRERLGMNGRKYVELHHDWPYIVGQLEDIYRQAIAEQKHSD